METQFVKCYQGDRPSHSGLCCCNCKFQLELFKTPCNAIFKGKISEPTNMYACILGHHLDNSYKGYLYEGKHGICEMHIPKSLISKKERILAGKLLNLASDEFGNHGCNDVDESLYEGWTLEERQQLVKEFHQHNGDPENYDENFLRIGDSSLMSFFAHKLKNNLL